MLQGCRYLRAIEQQRTDLALLVTLEMLETLSDPFKRSLLLA
jgi:hypothetical protein